MFTSILNDGTGNLTLLQGILCTGCSLLLGLWIAFIYTKQGSGSKSFRISIAILPAIVQSVIMMVNGNLGTGVAVLGTFSLVRFRSVPGSSKEILFIFFAMAIGLATGMGNCDQRRILLILSYQLISRTAERQRASYYHTGGSGLYRNI